MSARRKRVQIGWYCNHEDEPHDQRTHLARKLKRGKWVIESDPHGMKTISSVMHADHEPVCPKTVPAYIYVSADGAK